MSINTKEIGTRIKNARFELRFTQEKFAEKLNIGRVHLANIERGRYAPSLDLLVEIASLTGLSLDYLVMDKTAIEMTTKDKLVLSVKLLSEVIQSI